MPEARPTVRIHYHRPPDRTDIFVQELVDEDAARIVTLMRHTPLAKSVRVAGRTVLEDGAPVLWFTYPGRMYDVGIFHDREGRRTGWYANLLTPVARRGPHEWATTDLFLDVWIGADGTACLLDEDELAAAEASGWVTSELATGARTEAAHLLAAARRGEFPDPEVRHWNLDGRPGTPTPGAV